MIARDIGSVTLASGHRAEVERVFLPEGPWGSEGWWGEVTFICDDDRVLWEAPDWVVELAPEDVDPEVDEVEPPESDLWFIDQQYTEDAA